MITTPYDEIAKTPMSGATKEDAGALLDEGRRLVQAGANYVDGGNRRIKLAQELLTCPKTGEIPCKCPPTPTPTPPPTQHPLPDIPTVFPEGKTRADYLNEATMPGSGVPDIVGAFRLTAMPSHVMMDDPIVLPGQSGESHGHLVWGNTLLDAHSTYESLRTTGESTAMNLLNRSGYWKPWLEDGNGNIIMPNRITNYYKRRPDNDPWIAENGLIPVNMPNGIKMVFGHTMNGGPVTGKPKISCNGSTYDDFEEMEAAQTALGNTITEFQITITGPDCWDGENLDSPDHRSHIAYIERVNGRLVVPENHRFYIPQMTYIITYELREGESAKKIRFASDAMAEKPRGGSMHADFFEAWDPEAKAAWYDKVINGLLSANGGNFGDGTAMKRRDDFTFNYEPHSIPMPAHGHH